MGSLSKWVIELLGFIELIEFVGSFMRSGLAFRDDCPVL